MSRSARRRIAFAEWLREVSALLVVFPVIDQLVREVPARRFDWVVGFGGPILGLSLLAIGVLLLREE